MSAHLWSVNLHRTLSSEASASWNHSLPATNRRQGVASYAWSWFLLASLPRLQRNAVAVSRRTLDVLVSSLMLIFLLPVFLAAAVAIKLTDFGPVLFWQERIGMHGIPFRFPKFRSMVTRAEALKIDLLARNHHTSGVTFKMKRDPRATPVGLLLRRFSIDELPQLWCVLKGEMSLVGPRPAVPFEVDRYTLRNRVRLNVKPGLTCIWQVSGRSDLPFAEQVRLDERYFFEQSLTTDLRLLVQTVPAVISGKGAY